jgi:hypothetical protein
MLFTGIPRKTLARHILRQFLFYRTDVFAFIDVLQAPSPKYRVVEH